MTKQAWIPLVLFGAVLGCDATEPASYDQVTTATPRSIPVPGSNCEVALRDSFNEFSTILTAQSANNGDLDFIVNDTLGLGKVTASFASADSPLVSSVSVPDDTLNEIRARYQADTATFLQFGLVLIDNQLTYIIMPDSECTEDEFSLILFFVDEWFYFG